MSADKVYDIPVSWQGKAWIDTKTYQAMYQRSVDDPAGFWGEQGNASTGSSPIPR
jgi:acetyl-CoA synthetase